MALEATPRHYTPIARLAVGRTCEVHLAEAPNGDRVALKLPLPQHRDSTEVAARFAAMLEIGRVFRHEHAVRVLEVGQASGFSFLAMEVAPGATLRSVVEGNRSRRQVMDVPVALRLTLQICRALAAAHRTGRPALPDLEATGLGLGGHDPRRAADPIVHGDLSLHSVLLSPLGRVKLLPFACTAPAPHTATTVPVGHAGVPMHVAPEVLAGGPSTPSSDLWSLGHVLYELLAPSLPDGFDQGRAPMGWWRLGLLPPLAELRRDVPAEISHLAVHLLDADPAKRLASAEAVEEELLWALTNHGERTIPRLGDDDEPADRFPEDAITEHASRPWSSATAARLGPDPEDATISTEYLAAEADTEEVPLLGDPAARQTEPIGLLEVPTSPHHGLQLIGAPMAPDASAFTNTDMDIEPLREVARAQGRRPPLVPDRDLWLEPEANPVYIDSLEMEAPADESLEDLPAPTRPEVAPPTPAATGASTPVHDAAPAPRRQREAPARVARSETAALYYLIGTSLLFLAAVVMAVALFATR